MAYHILRNFSPESLAADVNRLEAQGWSTVGGVSVVAESSREVIILVNVVEVEYRLLYCQAMAKEMI
jgi:hypothetical protein